MQRLTVFLIVFALGVFAQETKVNTATCFLQPVDSVFNGSPQPWGLVTFATDTSGTDYVIEVWGLSEGNHRIGVYTYGDILSSNGTTLGGIYDSTKDSPFNSIVLAADNTGYATAAGNDDLYLKLNEVNDILGRSVAVFGVAGDVNKLALSCVIGRADGSDVESEANTVSNRAPAVRRATCQFRNTSIWTPGGQIAGWVDFEQTAAGVVVEYFIQNPDKSVTHTSHVHWTGDISAANGGNNTWGTWGHYNNTYFVGRPGALNEVGAIGNSYQFISDFNNVLTAQFTDNIISLNGRNSIIGRSVVLHGTTAGSGPRIAQCVIGIKSDGEGNAPVPAISTAGGGPQVDAQYLTVNQTTRASCSLKATTHGLRNLSGMVQFETQPITGYVRIRYHIAGLQPGAHNWHVHQWGELGSLADGRNSGDATQGHFVGTVINRPSGTLQQVGAIGDSKPIWADQFGFARGEFIDTNIRLNGPNGIIGRSIIVHGDGVSAATLIAQCAIGKRAETTTYDADINPVGQPANFATAHVVYTNLAGNQVLLGYVTFTQLSPDSQVGVTFNFDGLTPNGQHPWHVHQFGDLLSWDTVKSTADHFVGQNPVRSVGKKQEVGLLNDGTSIAADANGHAAGSFTDSQIKLSGINSIIGRAIVVHMSPDAAPRIAWGVIGLSPYNAAGLLRPSFLVILAAIVCAFLKW